MSGTLDFAGHTREDWRSFIDQQGNKAAVLKGNRDLVRHAARRVFRSNWLYRSLPYEELLQIGEAELTAYLGEWDPQIARFSTFVMCRLCFAMRAFAKNEYRGYGSHKSDGVHFVPFSVLKMEPNLLSENDRVRPRLHPNRRSYNFTSAGRITLNRTIEEWITQHLLAVYAALNGTHRLLFHQRFCCGMKAREIAELRGCTKENIGQLMKGVVRQLNRARICTIFDEQWDSRSRREDYCNAWHGMSGRLRLKLNLAVAGVTR